MPETAPPTPGEAAPAATGSTKSPPRRGTSVRSIAIWIGRLFTLLALTVVSVWNVTRSDALEAAHRAYKFGKYPQALGQALDHLDRQPWSREANRLAARCLWRLDFPDQADRFARKSGPLGHDDLHLKAFALLRLDRRDQAAEVYTAILDRWPDDFDALRRLAVVQMMRSQIPNAVDLSSRLSQAPDLESQVIGETMVGSFNHDMEEYDKAAVAFDRVLSLDPELRIMPLPKHLFWSYFGRDLLELGWLDKAKETLKVGLSRVGDDAELLNMLGVVYSLQGDPQEAEQSWRHITELNPKFPSAWANLGRLELSRGKPAAAIPLFQRAFDLETKQTSGTLYGLYRAYSMLGRKEDAARIKQMIGEATAKQTKAPRRGMGAPPAAGPPGSSTSAPRAVKAESPQRVTPP